MASSTRWAGVGLLALALATGASTSLFAQTASADTLVRQETFTPAEREVWAQEERFWKTIQEKDLEGHIALYGEDIAAWGGRQVIGKDQWRAARTTQFFRIRGDGPYVYQIKPLSVRVHGDTGIAYYHAQTSWTDSKGKPRTYDRILMHVHQKTPEGWEIIGGMSTAPPAPPSQ